MKYFLTYQVIDSLCCYFALETNNKTFNMIDKIRSRNYYEKIFNQEFSELFYF